MQQLLAFLLLPHSSAVGMQIRLSFSIVGLHLGLLGKLLYRKKLMLGTSSTGFGI